MWRPVPDNDLEESLMPKSNRPSSSSSKWTAPTVHCAVVGDIVEEESNVGATSDGKVDRGDVLGAASLIGAVIWMKRCHCHRVKISISRADR